LTLARGRASVSGTLVTSSLPADPTISLHLDTVDRHPGSVTLACLTGWIAPGAGLRIGSIGLRVGGSHVRLPYPFYRANVEGGTGDATPAGFCAVLPASLAIGPGPLSFTVSANGAWHGFAIEPSPGATVRVPLGPDTLLSPAPELSEIPGAEAGALLEDRLLATMARERRLTLRLDLINKCNLRCVMCHYSNEAIAGRPAQRITPEQFAAFFAPIAPMVREVVLSCGDEPLMSPHFEAILRELATRDPAVRIVFCTNGMLMNARISAAIVAARVHRIMFSFDGVTSGTLHRIRVGSDFGRIVGNIVGLREARERAGGGVPAFVFNYVMMDSNIHEAPLFVEMARRLGGETIDFRHVVPMDTYDIAHEMLERRPGKFNHYRRLIVAAAAALGMDIYIPPEIADAGAHDPSGDPAVTLGEFDALVPPADAGSAPAAARRPAGRPDRPAEAEFCFCDRPFTEVMIREQRDVYPCAWYKDRMGTLEGGAGLDEIFLGPEFQAVRRAMLDPGGAPGCRECPIKANRLPTQLLGSGARPAPAGQSLNT